MLNWFKKKTKKKAGKPSEELDFGYDMSDFEKFVDKFKKGGGELFISNTLEDSVEKIAEWLKKYQIKKVLCFDEDLKNLIENINSDIEFCATHECDLSLSTCECLLAFDGSVVISSDQVSSYNIDDLPDTCLIYAGKEQLVSNLGEGLRRINQLKKKNLPRRITSIRGAEMHNFSEIRNSKKILLIIEE